LFRVRRSHADVSQPSANRWWRRNIRQATLAILLVLCAGAYGGLRIATDGQKPSTLQCAYTGNSLSALAKLDLQLGKNLQCALVFANAAHTWAQWENPWFLASHDPDVQWDRWVAENSTRRTLILTLSLVPSEAPADWRQKGAAGNYDEYAATLARNLVRAGLGKSILRLSDEPNGTWYYDNIGTTTTDFSNWARYWARIAETMRAVPGAHFQFDWNINTGYRNIPLASYYPGDGVVDFITADAYDMSGYPLPTVDLKARFDALVNEPMGLATVQSFATQHGKRMALTEWGLANRHANGVGDDPAYIEGIASFVDQHGLAYQTYFERPSGWVLLLSDAPHSLAVYKRVFAG
jgi:hypothetical protein